MKDSEIHILLSRWLEDPDSPELRKGLESELKDRPELLETYKQLQLDYNKSIKAELPENPFFFSKLKSRMEGRKEEKAHVQRVRWAVYAATMSVSLVMGVLLGNQVESSSAVQGDEDVLTEELMVEDYSIDDTYLMVFEE